MAVIPRDFATHLISYALRVHTRDSNAVGRSAERLGSTAGFRGQIESTRAARTPSAFTKRNGSAADATCKIAARISDAVQTRSAAGAAIEPGAARPKRHV